MDSEKCKVLLRVIETGSLSAAAAELGYTPSGVSRMMASLEEEAGFRLLTRHRGGAKPTPECEYLLPAIREFAHWGEKCNELAAEVIGLSIGTVTIGTAYTESYPGLASLIAKFRQKYPVIEIRIVEGTSPSLCHMLDEHMADMCIISRREGKHEWIPLLDDPMRAWIPHDHAFAGKKSFPIKAFATEDFIDTCPGEKTDIWYVMEKYGITPHTKYVTSDSKATFSMVGAGLGVSLNNSINAKNSTSSVTVLPLEPSEIVNIGLALSTDLSPAAQKFAEYIAANKEILF